MNISTLSNDNLEQAAECLRTIAHPVRLRIIELLLTERYTVGELADLCNIASNQCSEHLKRMQRCGLFGSSREGRKVYYYVTAPHLSDLLACIKGHFSS